MKATQRAVWRYDPVAMARACDIEPDPWQALMLRSFAPRLIANCCRQSGKSTMAALIAMHVALFQAGSLILCLSPTLRQSSELFKKCLTVYRALDRPVKATAETALSLSLENRSRVISLPGSEETVRGYSKPALIILDEAARIPEALYASVRPMLAVSPGGRILMLSTPYGRQGVFWETWTSSNERSGNAIRLMPPSVPG
jgi:phage terminase large subunit-like protein